MSVPAGSPGDEVPEADWAEQVTEAGPPDDPGPSAPTAPVAAAAREANEADLIEQDFPVNFDDDEQ